MPPVISIQGFRCTNHKPNLPTLLSGAFDVENPCTWCANRKQTGHSGPVFHYVQQGRFEFPFIAESNCSNYSILHSLATEQLDPAAFAVAQNLHRHRNKIAELGGKFNVHWGAFDPKDTVVLNGRAVQPGEITNPNSMTPAQFFREASQRRADFFELSSELSDATTEMRARWGIKDAKLERWLELQSQAFRVLGENIEDLDSRKKRKNLTVISNWAVDSIGGNAAWDAFKLVGQLLWQIMKQP